MCVFFRGGPEDAPLVVDDQRPRPAGADVDSENVDRRLLEVQFLRRPIVSRPTAATRIAPFTMSCM